jgi:hypothetical protein
LRSFHLECLELKEEEIPAGDWLCKECKEGNTVTVELRVATFQKYTVSAATPVESLERGLDFISRLAQDPENFEAFGNDLIQCFYDISSVAVEPVMVSTCIYLFSRIFHISFTSHISHNFHIYGICHTLRFVGKH